MTNKWSDEVVRLLNNWAMWMCGADGGSSSPFPAYNLALPGPRAGNVIPILNGEAQDANSIILRLPERYQQPLRMHYLWPGRSDRSKAGACACCLNTYKARLDESHRLFQGAWYSRKLTDVRVA